MIIGVGFFSQSTSNDTTTTTVNLIKKKGAQSPFFAAEEINLWEKGMHLSEYPV